MNLFTVTVFKFHENQKVGIAVGTSLNKLHPNSPNNKQSCTYSKFAFQFLWRNLAGVVNQVVLKINA